MRSRSLKELKKRLLPSSVAAVPQDSKQDCYSPRAPFYRELRHPMEQYMTVSVRQIAITASADDVQNFFVTKIPGGDPVVKSLVSDANNVFQSATVTFKGRTKAECKATIERLQDPEHRILVDGAGTPSTLDFDVDFFGLTELANRCAVDEKPHFDVYFVHGLGGHAYDSFRHKAKNHRRSNMWARDILPLSLDRPGKKGRYLTFGYPAPIKDSGEISQSIEDTAMELLQKILDDRGKHCDRPIFFVCRSLGGLVICQAMLLLLKSNEDVTYREDFQKAFFSQGQTLIRGIIFFGTPFKGSRSANLGVKLATSLRLPLNKTHIMYLRVENQDVAALVEKFDKVTEQIDLALLMFYELKKTKVSFFKEHIVGRDSARGRFGKRVPKIGLRLDHHKLVKFSHPDKLYREDVEPRVKELVHNELDLYEHWKRFAAVRELEPPLLLPRDARRRNMQESPFPVILGAPTTVFRPSGYPSKQSKNPAGVSFPDSARPELDGPSRTTANKWVKDTIKEIRFNQDARRIDDVDDGSRETCDWILSKTEFQRWTSSLTDSVMFVQGGPGLGKSVLAKFLVEHLKSGDRDKDRGHLTPIAEQGRKPIVAHFFPRGTEYNKVDKSPKAILFSVLFQILEADPISCSKAIRNLFNRFNQNRNLDFYWTLFNDVRGILTRDLYCIVDGLDECIKEFKFPRQSTVDERMERFLKRLCDVAHGPNRQEKTSCTKILITTRPTVEVDKAVRGRAIVLEIQESDTISAVGRFVDDGVKHLGQRKRLTSPAQDSIKEKVTEKSGHVFQTAQIALSRLQNARYDLENPEVVSRALIRVNSRKSDDAYEEALEILQSAPLQDRKKAARIIRILFFLQRKISLRELEHTLLVDVQGSEPVLKATPIQSTLDVFIRIYLALLVKIDTENMVSLQHQTVRDYFQVLSVDKWQVYSCAERKGGHLQLALICIGSLILWRRHSVTQEDISAHDDDLVARLDKPLFISYASRYWDLHTREAGELINPYMPVVNKLLGFDSHQDYNEYYLPMLLLRWRQALDASNKDRDFFPLLPGSFLAINDLINVLRTHTRMRKTQRRGPIQRMLSWRLLATKNDTIEVDFDLNIQDKNGLGLTPLHYACWNGHLETAKLLLDCGASGNVYDAHRNSPFSMAVEGNWEKTAEMLIERDQCWDDPKQDDASETLHLACHYGMPRVVRHLLGIGFDVNAQVTDGWTPVHCAAEQGQTETLGILLKAGGSPSSVTKAGNTPLHYAAREGYLAAVELLLRYGADPAVLGSGGQSPHHKAAGNGHLEVLEHLIRICKDVRPDDDGDLPIHFAAIGGHPAIIDFLSDKSNLTASNKNKKLPIHYAAANGHLETVQKLLQLGQEIDMSIDVTCRDLSATEEEDPDGLLTPLYVAVALGHPKVAEYLISERADPNVCSFRKRTLLHEAAMQNMSETFKLHLKHKVSPFKEDDIWGIPLHIAATFGHSDIVEIYMGMQNIDDGLNMLDTDDVSALTLAIDNHHAEIAGKLITKGANIHLLDQYGASSLILSVELEDMTVFERLLEGGVNVNIASVFGVTALHKAAEFGKLEACKMLIERDANVNAETHAARFTPLHYAASHNRVDIVRHLLHAKADPFRREMSGACIMDYVTTYQPMLDLLVEYRKDYQPQPSEKQTDVLTQFFHAKLRALPPVLPTEHAGILEFIDSLYYGLVYASWNLNKYDIVRTCYEFSITKSADSTPLTPFTCDDCRKRLVRGSFWLCKQCPSTGICSECYEKRSKGIYTRGCSADHEYLELAGEEWRNLEEGKVNAKGQTFWEWVAELKEIHLTGYDDGLEASSALRGEELAAAQVDGGGAEKMHPTGDGDRLETSSLRRGEVPAVQANGGELEDIHSTAVDDEISPRRREQLAAAKVNGGELEDIPSTGDDDALEASPALRRGEVPTVQANGVASDARSL